MFSASIFFNHENEEVKFQYDGTESGFWKTVAENIAKRYIPNYASVKSEHGNADIKIAQRGKYIENGVTYPSMFVTVTNYIKGLTPSTYKKCYLTCIHPESNNYKAYIMRPQGDVFYADYGSIDEVAKGNCRTVREPYPSYLYWIRYYEKLSKGYKDQSEIFVDSKTVSAEDNTSMAEGLYALLLAYAKRTVTDNLIAPVTEKQVELAKKLLDKLRACVSVESFNKCLCDLMVISPRKRNPLSSKVSMYLANAMKDIPKILEFEENLVNAMDTVVIGKVSKNGISFEDFGIDVRPATESEIEHVKCNVNNGIKHLVGKIWKVTPRSQKARFEQYCKRNNITAVKEFWHGSRNENWESIIRNGLSLNPNAVITGKMFGNGIYFAPSARKSFGYTSCENSYWANGTSKQGFMGLYSTAYGNPYHPKHAGDMKPAMLREHKDCVHAVKEQVGLYNDEVVFYDEDAICIEYLVEMKCA